MALWSPFSGGPCTNFRHFRLLRSSRSSASTRGIRHGRQARGRLGAGEILRATVLTGSITSMGPSFPLHVRLCAVKDHGECTMEHLSGNTRWWHWIPPPTESIIPQEGGLCPTFSPRLAYAAGLAHRHSQGTPPVAVLVANRIWAKAAVRNGSVAPSPTVTVTGRIQSRASSAVPGAAPRTPTMA